MGHKNRLAQKIVTDLNDGAREGYWYGNSVIKRLSVAADILEPAEVQAFMRAGPGFLVAPPLLPGLKEHTRMEEPVLEAIQARTVDGEQMVKKPAGDLVW